jgi:hypothetical protein
MTFNSESAAEVVASFFMSTWIQAGGNDLSGGTGVGSMKGDAVQRWSGTISSTTTHGRENRRVLLP